MKNAKVCSWTKVMEQEPDSMSDSSVGQFLEVHQTDAGGGAYFVIRTERWAFDTLDELIEQLKLAIEIKEK